jgi:hypothetical protein
MVKMIVTFENGISVKELPKLQKIIENLGGKGEFVSLDSEFDIIRDYYNDVCRLAEKKMLATGKLEGAHMLK